MRQNPFVDDGRLVLTGKAYYRGMRKGDSISAEDYAALPEEHKQYFSEPTLAMKELGYYLPTVDLREQTHGIVTTPFGDTAAGGMFRVDANIVCTKESGEGEPTVDVVIGFTDENGEQEIPVITEFSLSQKGYGQGSVTVHTLERLSFRATINNAAGSAKYNLRLKVS